MGLERGVGGDVGSFETDGERYAGERRGCAGAEVDALFVVWELELAAAFFEIGMIDGVESGEEGGEFGGPFFLLSFLWFDTVWDAEEEDEVVGLIVLG